MCDHIPRRPLFRVTELRRNKGGKKIDGLNIHFSDEILSHNPPPSLSLSLFVCLPLSQVSDVSQLLSLDCLKSLNVSQCPLEEEGRVGTLSSCKHLTSLSLSQIPVGFTELAKLECEELIWLNSLTKIYD